jgi:hypothetical protein
MYAFLNRLSLGIFCLALVLGLTAQPAHAQEDETEKIRNKKALVDLLQKAEEEYRQSFRRPEKTHEYWAAMKFEIAVGKFDLGGLHLKLLLAKEPADEVDRDLVQLQEAEGYYPFLRLQDIKKWSDHPPFQEEAKANVQLLLKRLTAAVEKHLSDPERIKKFISRLDAPTPEERGYAFVQLQKSRQRAVPYLVEALRANVGKPLRGKVIEAFMLFERDFFPPLLEIFKAVDDQDARDIDLRLTLLDIFRKRGDKRVVPYLWHLSSSLRYPGLVRDAARDTLAYFLELDPIKLPPPKLVLTQMAEKYYQHKMKFDVGGHRFWKWDGNSLALQPEFKLPREAEEFFGLRYAREALDLDPAFKPAQLVFLNLVLERTYDQDLDKFFLKPMPPDLQQLLASIDTDLILSVLERGLEENNLAIVLPMVQMLGQRGELRAALASNGNAPRGLTRTLYYPDRRVQFASLTALLRMPQPHPPVISMRVVDVLKRFLAAEPMPRAMMVFCPNDQAAEARTTLKDIGFDPEVTGTMKEAFEKLNKSADYDLLFFHPTLPTKDLTYALTQFRADADQGRLPLLVLAKKENVDSWTKLCQRYPNTWVLADTFFLMPDELKKIAESKIKEASGALLSVEERKKFTKESMDYLWKMARGELAGYDVRPAQEALEKALRSEDLSILALETLAKFPGRESQARLASVVLDDRYAKLKVPAVMELNRHIQKNGLLLDKNQLLGLRQAHQTAADNPELRAQLALVLGNLGISAQQTGTRLFRFTPQPSPPPEKKEEK